MYSFSQLRMFLRCPYQYHLRYNEGLKMPPDGGLARGLACHHAILMDKDNEKDGLLSAKMKGEIWGLDQVVDTFNDAIDSTRDTIEWNDERMSYENARTTCQGAVKEYAKYARQVEPEALEQRIEVAIEGVPYVGYIDLICPSYNADLKFKSRKSDVSVTELIQLGIYNLYNDKPYSMLHNVIIRKKSVEVIANSYPSTALPFDRIKRYNEIFVTMKEKELFPPCNPDNWCCSPDWCGYTKICPYYSGKKGE